MAGIGQLGSSAAAWCITGALTLHAVAAGVVLSCHHDKKILLPTGGPTPVLRARLLSLSNSLSNSTTSPDQAPLSRKMAVESTAEPATTQQANVQAEAKAPSPASALQPEPTALVMADSVPSPQPTGKQPLDDYLPRDLLTQAPSASQPILLDFPADLPDEQRLSIVLRLYVDEQGVVRRVARVGGDTPEQAQSIAEQAFLQARFNPGEVDGHPVKSIIHVEVTFDSTSLDSPR